VIVAQLGAANRSREGIDRTCDLRVDEERPVESIAAKSLRVNDVQDAELVVVGVEDLRAH
jgi:hypothetical protein